MYIVLLQRLPFGGQGSALRPCFKKIVVIFAEFSLGVILACQCTETLVNLCGCGSHVLSLC